MHRSLQLHRVRLIPVACYACCILPCCPVTGARTHSRSPLRLQLGAPGSTMAMLRLVLRQVFGKAASLKWVGQLLLLPSPLLRRWLLLLV